MLIIPFLTILDNVVICDRLWENPSSGAKINYSDFTKRSKIENLP